mmetsp:Transcript_10456/g.22672  ORF Transcript_10456/g.22672 Transcript_10456/m.22672 type:complete len:88 (+) Transcript_10456:1876-2139(+)
MRLYAASRPFTVLTFVVCFSPTACTQLDASIIVSNLLTAYRKIRTHTQFLGIGAAGAQRSTTQHGLNFHDRFKQRQFKKGKKQRTQR